VNESAVRGPHSGPYDYTGRRVTVMGLGRFGGGLGAVQFLLERGARVSVTDLRSPQELQESLSQIDASRLETLALGQHPEAMFTDTDLLVVNPAVRRNHPLIALARSHGIPTTSEIGLFWRHQQGRIVGVTGSNGKSTTTALIHHLLTTAGERTWLGGNLGGSLLPEVEKIAPQDWVVLELSSFMLADLNEQRVSPQVAVVTNFAPNHLDWHPDLDDYRHAKQAILRWQSAGDVAVLNADDADVRTWTTMGAVRWFSDGGLVGFGTEVSGSLILCREDPHRKATDALMHGEASSPSAPHPRPLSPEYRGEGRTSDASRSPDCHFDLSDGFQPPGRHNRWNAAAAIAAVRVIGISDKAIRAGLKTFRSLPHRLELVAEARGRRFYNDSLATTPESAVCALEAFADPIVLLAGGYDKKVDLHSFAEAISRRAKAVVLMGQTAAELDCHLRDLGSTVPRMIAGNFARAMETALAVSAPGDAILLSPGCASFDWFRNFADRGEQFRRRAGEWADDVGTPT
jgi:UDP-N-acetylmuramoylalanine--D-glutamate ligase